MPILKMVVQLRLLIKVARNKTRSGTAMFFVYSAKMSLKVTFIPQLIHKKCNGVF